MNDQGIHFINTIICILTKEFEVHHQKSTLYHPQANGTVQAFKKIMENTLTKIGNVNRYDWDLKVPTVLWAYRTTSKKLTRHTPFKLFYGQEVVVPLECLVPSLRIEAITQMTGRGVLHKIMNQLLSMEEDQILAGFHQQVQKARNKSWHD
jgi:hypothetical protein